MKTILLAVGAEQDERIDQMISTAIQEASGSNAEVVLLHVFENDHFRSLSEKMNLPAGTDPTALASRNVNVAEIREQLEDEGIPVLVEGAVGNRSDTILHMAEQYDADRIIVGGRKRTPVGKAVFGSTAQRVMLNASCPTTFVRA